MKTIKINLHELGKAIHRANQTTCDWQAEMIEILLIPKIYRRWQELNKQQFNYCPEVTRWPGLPFIPAYRGKETKCWSLVSGYIVTQWNDFRDDYYSHSASTAWDGIRRETVHMFLEKLRHIYYDHKEGRDPEQTAWELYRDQKIIVETSAPETPEQEYIREQSAAGNAPETGIDKYTRAQRLREKAESGAYKDDLFSSDQATGQLTLPL